jgi:hypothetical protein
MKAKLIRESQNFERGIEPIRAIDIGILKTIHQYLIDNELKPDSDDEFNQGRILNFLFNNEKYDYIKILKDRGLSLNSDDSQLLRKLAWKKRFTEAKILIELGSNIDLAIESAEDKREIETTYNLKLLKTSLELKNKII